MKTGYINSAVNSTNTAERFGVRLGKFLFSSVRNNNDYIATIDLNKCLKEEINNGFFLISTGVGMFLLIIPLVVFLSIPLLPIALLVSLSFAICLLGAAMVLLSKFALEPTQFRTELSHPAQKVNINSRFISNFNRPLSPRECVVNIYVLLDNSKLEENLKKTVLDNLKNIFFKNEIKKSDIIDVLPIELDLETIKIISRTKENEEMLDNYPILHKDSFYTRVFETHISNFILRSKDKNIEDITCAMRKVLETAVEEKNIDLEWVKRRLLSSATSGWKYNIPEYNEFISTPTEENLKRFISYSGIYSKYSIILLSYIQKDYIIDKATAYEMNNKYKEIKQHKQGYTNLNIDQMEQGNTFHHQSYFENIPRNNTTSGCRGITSVDFKNEKNYPLKNKAILYGLPYCHGLSGISNIMNFIIKQLDLTEEQKIIAQFVAASSTVFNGGHAYNETYAVFHDDFSDLISYEKMYSLSYIHKLAMDHAFDEVIKSRKLIISTATENTSEKWNGQELNFKF